MDNSNLGKLIIAFDKNDKDKIKNIIETDANIFFVVIRRGPVQLLDLIPKYNINLNLQNNSRETLLMSAIQMGRIDFIKKLLEMGADPNIVNKKDETALDMGWNSEEIAELLVKFGGKQNKKMDPLSIFSLACEPRELSVLEHLNTNTTDKNGWTPLMLASRRNWVACVKKLINLGHNVNESGWKGQTPLMIACDYCNFAIVDELIQQNALLDMQDDMKYTALMHACKNQYSTKIVRQLYEYGAGLDLKNIKNKTAREIALIHNNNKIAAILKK